jgi:hypothetical protein
MRLYAEPQLNEAQGVQIISTHYQTGLDCLNNCALLHPEYSNAISVVEDIILQACNIYLLRAHNSLDSTLSYELVEKFLAAQEACPEGFPGEQVLIWAFFIVAAESSTPEHHVFFTAKLHRYYQRIGFSNTLKGLSLLEKIWSMPAGYRWTSVLPQGHIFVI